jgi:uncharacterized protein with PIN domain/sulfur carrier protein ThiS
MANNSFSKSATLRFYAELNDFLPDKLRQRDFIWPIDGTSTVKNLIESLGVPHIEIDLILVNGDSVDFSYLVKAGDRISVYPVYESFDIAPVNHLRATPLRIPRFILDTHLGKLAAYLRLLGFDTLYRNDYPDPVLAQVSSGEKRILLSKDRWLLMRKMVTHGYFVRAIVPREQVVEVLRRFDLFGLIEPFKRCIRCNGLLVPVDKAEVEDLLPPNTAKYFDDFSQCAVCTRVYWKGSHYQRMQRFIEDVIVENAK